MDIKISDSQAGQISQLDSEQRQPLLDIVVRVLQYRDIVSEYGWLEIEDRHAPFDKEWCTPSLQAYCDKLIELVVDGLEVEEIIPVYERAMRLQHHSAQSLLGMVLFTEGMLAIRCGHHARQISMRLLASFGFEFEDELRKQSGELKALQFEQPVPPLPLVDVSNNIEISSEVLSSFPEADNALAAVGQVLPNLPDSQIQHLMQETSIDDWLAVVWLLQSQILWSRMLENVTQRTAHMLYQDYCRNWKGAGRIAEHEQKGLDAACRLAKWVNELCDDIHLD